MLQSNEKGLRPSFGFSMRVTNADEFDRVSELLSEIISQRKGSQKERREQMRRGHLGSHILAIVVCAMVLATCAAQAQHSFLKANNEIITLGDSITEAGIYQEHMQQVIDTLYPDAGIKLSNPGGSAQGVANGARALEIYSKRGTRGPKAFVMGTFGNGVAHAKNPPNTFVTIMYGVNDIGWSANDIEAKTEKYLTHLNSTFNAAKAQSAQVVFVRGTPLRHNAFPDPWMEAIDLALDYLLDAAAEFAAEKDVHVIDVRGAYRDALAEAWAKDPLYEFTPDVLNPTHPGHAAIAAEMLRAMGAGLPLATGARGPMRMSRESVIKIEAMDKHVMIAQDGELAVQVRCRNTSAKEVKGEVTIVAGSYKETKDASVAGRGMQTLEFSVPASAMKRRWECLPLYMVFKGEDVFTAHHALLFYSRVSNASEAPFKISSKDFKRFSDEKGGVCPVSEAKVWYDKEEGATVQFKWDEKNAVPAQAGFKNRFGETIHTPLDLNNRDGQPCDAVELIFDLRPDDAIGRFTSNADATPEGVTRLGVYYARAEGKVVAKVEPAYWDDPESFEQKDDGSYILRLRTQAHGSVLGFSMRVTDANTFGFEKGPVFYLTGRQQVSHEPMSYIMLTGGEEGIFCRIGY